MRLSDERSKSTRPPRLCALFGGMNRRGVRASWPMDDDERAPQQATWAISTRPLAFWGGSYQAPAFAMESDQQASLDHECKKDKISRCRSSGGSPQEVLAIRDAARPRTRMTGSARIGGARGGSFSWAHFFLGSIASILGYIRRRYIGHHWSSWSRCSMRTHVGVHLVSIDCSSTLRTASTRGAGGAAAFQSSRHWPASQARITQNWQGLVALPPSEPSAGAITPTSCSSRDGLHAAPQQHGPWRHYRVKFNAPPWGRVQVRGMSNHAQRWG